MLTQGEAIDFMDDARNNPALENQADGASVATNHVETPRSQLRALLESLRWAHVVAEDCWYSCPKSGESCHDGLGREKDECTCGADKHNATLDEALSRLAELEADAARLDWLEGERRREQEYIEARRTFTPTPIPDSLFRRNTLITRAAIDAAMSTPSEARSPK